MAFYPVGLGDDGLREPDWSGSLFSPAVEKGFFSIPFPLSISSFWLSFFLPLFELLFFHLLAAPSCSCLSSSQKETTRVWIGGGKTDVWSSSIETAIKNEVIDACAPFWAENNSCNTKTIDLQDGEKKEEEEDDDENNGTWTVSVDALSGRGKTRLPPEPNLTNGFA